MIHNSKTATDILEFNDIVELIQRLRNIYFSSLFVSCRKTDLSQDDIQQIKFKQQLMDDCSLYAAEILDKLAGPNFGPKEASLALRYLNAEAKYYEANGGTKFTERYSGNKDWNYAMLNPTILFQSYVNCILPLVCPGLKGLDDVCLKKTDGMVGLMLHKLNGAIIVFETMNACETFLSNNNVEDFSILIRRNNRW